MATQTQSATGKVRPAAARQTQRQVRNFVLIWTFITLIMGLATFVAIYFAYQPNINTANAEVALNNNNNPSSDPVLVIASPTVLPTEVLPTSSPVPPTDVPTDTPPTDAPVENDTTTEGVAVAQVDPTDVPTNTPEPAPTFTPPDEDETFRVGIQVQVPGDFNPDVMEGDLRAVQQMNLNWVKIQARWEFIEPEPGQYDFRGLDLAMEKVRFFQKSPMLSIVTAPDWARESGVNLDEHGPAASNETYVNFVRTLLQRYEGQIYGVEVWNEQNLDREWTSTRGLSAQNYVSLLRETYNMVQVESPGTIVISGALAPTGLDDGIGAIDDFRYMQLMIDAGMLDVVDCVGAHHNGINVPPLERFDNVTNQPDAIFRGPFDNPHHSWSFRSTLEGYTQRVRNAGSDKKLCVTEFGWPSSEDIGGYPRGFEFAADNSLEEQATYFVQALDWMEQSGDVWLAFIWNLNYGPQAGWDQNNDNVPYSLIGPNFNFRPAYDAVRDWAADYRARISN